LYEVFIVFLLALSVIFTISIHTRLRRKVQHKFDLYLYTGSGSHLCDVWIRSFALEPDVYTFSAANYIENKFQHKRLFCAVCDC